MTTVGIPNPGLANKRGSSGTRTRQSDVNPQSGMCAACIRSCTVLCEISKSAFRGKEVLYPEPEEFGASTSSGNKYYGLGWEDFQLMVQLQGAYGIEADSDKAIFPNVDVTTDIGGVPMKVPVFTAGLGSTAVAKRNWGSIAGGAALSGVVQVVGENVCGMDPDSKFKEVKGEKKIELSPDMEFRIKAYRDWWDGKYGDIVVQTNVEDQRLGVDLYVINDLEVNVIERKWGQGAKAIGGEVRLHSLERARLLKSRGYVVIPDPDDPVIAQAFKDGVFKSFERHSRVGMPEYDGMMEDIAWLRDNGAKKVFMKTGAYRPVDVAFTFKVASGAKVEHLTFDGAGGGTGMSPVPMMNEASTPTVYLYTQILNCARILKKKGKHVPTLSIAGGMIEETAIFKAIAMSNLDGKGPLVKAVAMARSPITAAFKGDYYAELAKEGKLPKPFVKMYGDDPEKYMVSSPKLKDKWGDKYKDIPKGAIGVFSYYHERIGSGLQQLLAGNRKWKLDLLDRDDVCSLTPLAEEVTGIPMAHRYQAEEMEKILLDW
ncbi:MAG: glutamate synthase-related protein [Candidatus Hermodarchaeota archaeon]